MSGRPDGIIGIDTGDRHANEFLCSSKLQIGSWSHQAVHLMGTGPPFPAIKQPGREADHSPHI